MGFAPLDLVNVLVGRSSIKLYPRLTASMPVYERAHAFQVNKTALTNARGVEISQILDAFGAQMNSSSTVEGLISAWRRYFQERWMDFTHLAILSFHQSNGNRIDDTTVADSPEVLLPIIDGPAAACCTPNVKFVRVRCTINFAGLVSVNPYPVHPVLRIDYYIELPQTIQGVRRGANNINIETFCGAADLPTLSTAEVWVLLDQVQQDAPILLKASDFNLQAANTNSIVLPRLTVAYSSLRGIRSALHCSPRFARDIHPNLRPLSTTSSNATSTAMEIKYALAFSHTTSA